MDRSSLPDLNHAIERHNPFNGFAALEEPDVWRSQLPDYTPPQREAFEAVQSALAHVERGKRVCPLVVLGEMGSGKTHLIARVWQHLRDSSSGAFVYIDAQQLVEAGTVRQVLLNAVAQSLTHRGASGCMQWQELASSLANQAFQGIDPSAKTLTPDLAVRRLRGQPHDRNRSWVDRVAEAFFKVRPDVGDPDVVRAVLWTLAPSQAPFARKWLAGRSLAAWKLSELGLPDRSSETRESRAGDLLQEILLLLGDWSPLVIAVDRLDGEEIEEPDDELFEDEWDMRVPIGAIVRLSQSLRTLRCPHGAVLLSVMEPHTWERIVQPILGRMTRHLSDRANPIQLPDPDEPLVRGVVRTWLRQFYRDRKLVPPTPLYPFDAAQIRAIAREGADLHEAIEWCAENFRPVENDPLERVAQAFERSQAQVAEQGEIDEWQAVEALQLGFESLIGSTVEGVEVRSVELDVMPKTRSRQTLDLKVTGSERGNPVTLGIMLTWDERGQVVGNRLRTLCNRDAFGLTRGVLVRPFDREIPARWKARQWLDRLTESGGGWVDVTFESLAPLIALGKVLEQRQAWGLTKPRILAFATAKRLAASNRTIRDILRSGDRPSPSPSRNAEPSIPPERSSQPQSSDLENRK